MAGSNSRNPGKAAGPEEKKDTAAPEKKTPEQVVTEAVREKTEPAKKAAENAGEKSVENPEPDLFDLAASEDPKEYEKLRKKQEEQAKKAAQKNLKEEQKAEREATAKEKKDAKESEKKAQEPDAETKESPGSGETNADARPAAAAQPESGERRPRYAKVMTTGQYIGACLLMLIPGINILCVLVWALGGAKNPNKVNFTRGCIVLFLVEILLTAMLGAAGYIYLDRNQAKYLKELDGYTNGLISYFDIKQYDDLQKLRNIPKYLVSKDAKTGQFGKKIPATRVVENPDEIKTYQDFEKMYAGYTPGSVTKAKLGKKEQANDGYYTGENFHGTATNLTDFMKKYHIDASMPGLVYIIIDNNGSDNCIIAFDPTGDLQKVPTIQMDNKTICLGGVS